MIVDFIRYELTIIDRETKETFKVENVLDWQETMLGVEIEYTNGLVEYKDYYNVINFKVVD